MDWHQVLGLRAWTPLAEVAASAEPVSENLFRIGDDAYVRTRDVNRKLESGDPHAPFITRAYWACTTDAIRREMLGDPKVGGEPPVRPPPATLLVGVSPAYGHLIESGRATGENFSERAVYSNVGDFLYKAVTVGRLTYCFLDPTENRGEPTFLIHIALVNA